MKDDPATARKQRYERKGRRAEWYAALPLLLKGYRILALRYRTPVGEVDLVARKGNLIAFVEVKARKSVAAGVHSVSLSAQKRILAAANLYISQQPDAARLSWRFDIIVVCPMQWPAHLEGAF